MRKASAILLSILATVAFISTTVKAEDAIPDPFAQVRAQKANTNSAPVLNAQAPAPIVIPQPPSFEAQSWALMDYYSGRIITEYNSHERIWPASLTKMMTAYVIGMELKAGRLHMDDDVTITEDAWAKKYSDSSKMFIEVGKTIKVGDLLKGIIIQSGNDACVAMAIHLAGTQEGFVSVMNTYAQKLGLKNTHFANVHGLFDEGNYSTAYDMALLGRAVIRDLPDEYHLYSQKEFTFNGIKQGNRNRLLWDKTLNVDGIKTGHLSQVGYNLVASALENNMRLIASVIGAKSEKARADHCRSLLNYGFHYFEQYTPFKANTPLLSRTIRLGNKNVINLGLKNDLSVLIPRGRQDKIKVSYRLKQSSFRAPLDEGTVLGAIDVKLEDVTLATVPLVSLEKISEGGFFEKIWDHIVMFFISDNPETEQEK